MRKIPTLFVRDFDARPAHVLPQVNPGCEWVLSGEGVATRKYDGTCVMLDQSGEWWARREVKAGKAAPDRFVPISTDDETGKTVGWEPIAQSAFAKFHAEALEVAEREAGLAPEDPPTFEPGTYELVGPKVNGNPEGQKQHELIAHTDALVVKLTEPLLYDTLRPRLLELADEYGMEGVVWHHPDGRMCKLKARDFPKGAA